MGGEGQLEADQQRYLDSFEAVKEKLLTIAGVVDVGVGLKETDDGLTAQIAYRVYVDQKRPEAELSPEQIVPKEIDGFRTDVITVRHGLPIIGFNDENDEKNYKVKVGGIYVGNDKEAAIGTLGCFCRRTTDNKIVFLSNHHVLFDSKAEAGSEVGQPQYDDSCCCTCNKIGVVLDGDKALDCAIASLDSDVPFIPKIKQIKKGDGTIELNGFIAGEGGPLVSGDEVWKIGARTGLTRGTVSEVTPKVEIHPIAPFTYVANHGDSGSVVVRLSNGNVVALLRAIDKEIADGGTLGLAVPIAGILTKLNITVIPTDTSQTYDVALRDDVLDRLVRVAPNSGFDEIAAGLRQTRAGTELLELADAHRSECLRLVNTCRPVTVAWHRNRGPTFMAAFARSAKVPEYVIPGDIDGVTRELAVRALREAFERYGSDELQMSLSLHGDRLVAALVGSDTIGSFIEAWATSEPMPAGTEALR